jgi:hypothetical protein
MAESLIASAVEVPPMTFDESLERALRSPAPVLELRALAQRLLSEGQQQTALLDRFEAARADLRRAGRDADEDAVLDVMDFLVGWCSPHMRLTSRPAQDAEG